MPDRQEYPRPKPWPEHAATAPASRWKKVIFKWDWRFQWIAHYLSRAALLDVVVNLGKLSTLVAVIAYIHEYPDRIKQKHYQAWQVINTAQGKGGNGGRIEALQELNEDHQHLVGVDASGAFLQGVRLKNANLSRADFHAADLRDAVLLHAHLERSDLESANFRGADLGGTWLGNANLSEADMVGADLSGAHLEGVDLEGADLRNANLKGVSWNNLKSVKGANLYGVQDAPSGFVNWAMTHGAVSQREDE
jgi:hypothetical protein